MKNVWGFIGNQFKYLFAGLVTWLPIGIILFAIGYVTGLLEGLGQTFFDFFLVKGTIPPGLGFIFWVLVFYITGLIFNRTPIARGLARIPVIGMFFGHGGEAMTLDKLARLTPCVFLYSSTCVSYGWILWEQPVRLNGNESEFNLVTVYYPNVPALLSGEVYLLHRAAVIRLGNSTQEMINVLLYGLKKPESIKYLPWADEDPQDFKKRAMEFGMPPGR
jgi:uncharacterized membrane protein